MVLWHSCASDTTLTVIIVVLSSVAGRENVVHRTDSLRFAALQWLHLELMAAANLRYSPLYVALLVVTHPHRLCVHYTSAVEERTVLSEYIIGDTGGELYSRL